MRKTRVCEFCMAYKTCSTCADPSSDNSIWLALWDRRERVVTTSPSLDPRNGSGPGRRRRRRSHLPKLRYRSSIIKLINIKRVGGWENKLRTSKTETTSTQSSVLDVTAASDSEDRLRRSEHTQMKFCVERRNKQIGHRQNE